MEHFVPQPKRYSKCRTHECTAACSKPSGVENRLSTACPQVIHYVGRQAVPFPPRPSPPLLILEPASLIAHAKPGISPPVSVTIPISDSKHIRGLHIDDAQAND